MTLYKDMEIEKMPGKPNDMATKCPKCGYNEFEVINGTPVNSNFELIFVRCVQCKTLVGILDFYNVGALIKKLAEKMNIDLNK